MTPLGAAIFSNLPALALAQSTALWRELEDGYRFLGPCDPHPCFEFGLLPVWASWSYAVRAVSPYAIGGPAGPQPLWASALKETQAHLNIRGTILLDIRTPEEYDRFHFEGAVLVPTPPPPLSPIEVDDLCDQLMDLVCQPHVRLYRPIVTYSNTGTRAALAAALLREAGFVNAMCAGGIETLPLNRLVEQGVELCP